MTVTFKEELRTSNLSLDELLCKHGLNLKTALNKKKRRIPRERKEEPTYIQRTKTSFQIYRKNNGEQTHFGAYKSLEDAEKVILKLKECNWDKNRLEDITKDLGVKRKTKNKYTLWDAHHVRYMKHYRIKSFRLLWNAIPVQCGCFLDPVTCEVIYSLIEDAVGE